MFYSFARGRLRGVALTFRINSTRTYTRTELARNPLVYIYNIPMCTKRNSVHTYKRACVWNRVKEGGTLLLLLQFPCSKRQANKNWSELKVKADTQGYLLQDIAYFTR